MFQRLGGIVGQHPYRFIAAWSIVLVVCLLFSPDPERVSTAEPPTVLPAWAPSDRAFDILHRAFPNIAGRSRAVAIFERPGGLTGSDLEYLTDLARRLREHAQQYEGWRVLAPADSPLHGQRLISTDGQCAMLVVLLDVNFTTHRASRLVDALESLMADGRPTDLRWEITGTAGLGRDYALVAERALDRTTRVTVTLVFIILALVYRAPLAALVPLLSITASVVIALKVLDYLALLGWDVSTREKLFTVVLLYGAGTDYAMFWISRYREELSAGSGAKAAAGVAMGTTGPAILAGAGTTILGLMSMIVAELVPVHNAGRIMGIVLVIGLLAATTLAPALALAMGRGLFWPTRPSRQAEIGLRRFWMTLAAFVVRRPAVMMLSGLVVMIPPMWTAWRLQFHYDTLAELPPDSSADRGARIAEGHFPAGQLYPSSLLVVLGQRRLSPQEASEVSAEIERASAAVPGVNDVRGLMHPAGTSPQAQVVNQAVRLLGPPALEDYFLSADRSVLRVELVTPFEPLSVQAMETLGRARQAVRRTVDRLLGAEVEVLAEGITAYISDVRDITRRDQRWVKALALLLIWLVVLVLVRDAWLSAFMLLATLATFGAALGLTEWVFVHLLGFGALDWKVELFLFVIVVAVGQDYNIFLVTRLFEELGSYDLKEATERAVVRTGPIISSCGLIMAATLGSLISAGLRLYEQLGFSLAAGMLIDTFLVRPLLIPSFFLLRYRLGGSRPGQVRAAGVGSPGRPGGRIGGRVDSPLGRA